MTTLPSMTSVERAEIETAVGLGNARRSDAMVQAVAAEMTTCVQMGRGVRWRTLLCAACCTR